MRVDETGHDQMRAMVDLDHVICGPGLHARIGARRRDHTVLDQQRAIAFIGVGGAVVDCQWRAMKAQEAAADERRCHGVLPSSTALSNQAVRSWRSSVVMSVMLPGGMAWLRPAWI
ncbi:hypothetical protein D3C87_1549810 [compost metagenome]